MSCSLATGRWCFEPVMVYDFVNAIIIAYVSVIESMYEKIVTLLIIRGPGNHSAANMPIVYAINYSLPELLADSLRASPNIRSRIYLHKEPCYVTPELLIDISDVNYSKSHSQAPIRPAR
jgi:hypothetical protein